MTPEQIVANAAAGQVFEWQLYVEQINAKSEAMLARVSRLDAIKFIVLTLDSPVLGKREDDDRMGIKYAIKNAQTGASPVTIPGGVVRSQGTGLDPSLTWVKTLPWPTQHTNLPIILKGIQTHEDAYMASLYTPRIKGIVISNHVSLLGNMPLCFFF